MQRVKLRKLKVSKPMSFYWILTWALSYIACFIVKPNFAYTPVSIISPLVGTSFGLVMLIGLLYNIKPLLFGFGVLEVFGGVASWTGVIRWNVAWTTGYDPLAQIAMALLDLISAIFLFNYSLTPSSTAQP
ncbi:MAG: hypothetical protein QG670_2515 [Thermoproteota archaeon]|nr:hypothetical protein [Thermoproteota archaeon]